jgi:hypothetical protein
MPSFLIKVFNCFSEAKKRKSVKGKMRENMERKRRGRANGGSRKVAIKIHSILGTMTLRVEREGDNNLTPRLFMPRPLFSV